jgi:hypothetical protein
MPDTWREVPWKRARGYGDSNADRERLWLSPGCLAVRP